jgi:diguanylate cyclase (GGDEF)-like protein
LAVVPLTVLPLLGIGWFAYTQLQETSEQRAREQLATLLDQIALNTEARVTKLGADTRVFASSPLVERYLRTTNEDQRYQLLYTPLLHLLDDLLDAYDEYTRLQLFLNDGLEDAVAERSDAGPALRLLSVADIVDLSEGESDYVEVQLIGSVDDGSLALRAIKPLWVLDRSKDPLLGFRSLRGYLAVSMGLDFLESQVRSARLGETGYVVFADRSGRVLFQPEGSVLGRRLPEMLWQRLINPSEQGGPWTGRYADRTVLLEARYAGAGIFAVGVLPEAELKAAGRRLGGAVALATLVTVVLSVLFLFVVLRHLVMRPVRKLHLATEEVGRGNLAPALKIEGSDELAQLASSFVRMAENVRQSAQQIEYLAYRDSLTGLPNRRLFMEHLAAVLRQAQRDQTIVALLFLDLDNFKRVNDSLGHAAGDALIQEVAERLAATVRAEDVVAHGQVRSSAEIVSRLGGDEFVVLLPNLKDMEVAARVAKRMLEALTQPCRLGNDEIYASVSIGISLFPNDGESPESLIRGADTAMYHAKEQGRNNFQFYSRSLNAAAVRRLTVETRLRRAIEDEALRLNYQPQVDVTTGDVIGFEALARWTDPELGVVPPTSFVGVAEESDLIIPLSDWTLAEACRQMRAWRDEGYSGRFVSVNISAVMLRRQRLHSLLERHLQAFDLPPECIEIELTETALISTGDEAVRHLEKVRELGVRIALDDFGTGYSSLTYLRRFPIQKIKIDRSFVKDLEVDAGDASIVSATLAMARALDVVTTAEGVETTGQLEILRLRGCDTVQGYLLGRPVPPEQAIESLQPRRSSTG